MNHPIGGSPRLSGCPHWFGTGVLRPRQCSRLRREAPRKPTAGRPPRKQPTGLPGPPEERFGRYQEPGQTPEHQPGRAGTAGGAGSMQPGSRRPGPAAPPLHPAGQVRYRRSDNPAGPEIPFGGRWRGGQMKGLSFGGTGQVYGGIRLTGSPLTPPAPSGIIVATGWPGSAANTPGRGATCLRQVMRWYCTTRRPAPGRGGSF